MIKGVSSVRAGGRICEVQSERGIPLRIPIPIPSNTWIDLQIRVFYLVIAVWVLVAHRKAPSRVHRLFFSSIVAIAVLVLAADLLAWLQPKPAAVVQHPIGTTLAYLFGTLVILSLLVDARSTRTPRRPPDKRDAVVRAIYGMAFSR